MNTVFRELFNIVTGLASFVCWYTLAQKFPEHSLKIAGSCILMLLGFSGRETLIEIIKIVRIVM